MKRGTETTNAKKKKRERQKIPDNYFKGAINDDVHYFLVFIRFGALWRPDFGRIQYNFL